MAVKAASGVMLNLEFQSPSRGGHLRGIRRGNHRGGNELFQSPSRGGHLRGFGAPHLRERLYFGFSPLHEGDTSVAVRGSERMPAPIRFQSPSRGGHLRGVYWVGMLT